eukprot:scaffold308626_cov33-Tisochrysis_lutea.AAC.1
MGREEFGPAGAGMWEKNRIGLDEQDPALLPHCLGGARAASWMRRSTAHGHRARRRVGSTAWERRHAHGAVS